MSLIPLVESDTANETQAAILSQLPPLNLFKGLLHSPSLTTLVAQLGGNILYLTKLPAKAREAAILRIAHLTNCSYEIAHHQKVGRDIGFTDADLRAIELGDLGDLDAAAHLAARWADEAVRSGRASTEVVQESIDNLGAEQTIELAVIVGYYTMLSQVLRSLEIPLESGPSAAALNLAERPAALD